MADGVDIRIKGDTSDLEKAQERVKKTANAAAASLGKAYEKAGMTASEAMKKAWVEIKEAQSNGTTVVINGLETIITKQEKVARSAKSIPRDAYKPLATSADSTADKVDRAMSRVNRAITGIKTVATSTGRALTTAFKGISIVSGAISAAWSIAGVSTVKYTATIEQLEASFETMTGSATKAANVMERIKKLGAATPFETTDLAETVQLLMNYGFEADRAIDRMEMLGDIAQGNADKMNRIATAYGQMSSAGKVQLEDVKQMIEAGFNPLQEIAQSTGESMESLYERISKGTLAVDEITAAMQRATSEGGKYYQSMLKQAETINGLTSTLQDNVQQLMAKAFEPATDALREQILPGAIAIIDEMDQAFEERGFDGMADAFLAQVPTLTETGAQVLQKVISGASKKLPGLAKGLLKSLPSVLRGAIGVGNDLTAAAFEVTSTIIGGVIEQLPELAPDIISGLGQFTFTIVEGIFKNSFAQMRAFDSVFKDLFTLSFDEVWSGLVDNELSETVKVAIDTEVDVSEGKSSIEAAYSDLRTALQTDLLTEDQKSEILGMIDGDYSAIKDKLLEFGLTEQEAAPLAMEIAAANGVIDNTFRELDVGVDSKTLRGWFRQANGSRTKLRETLISAGLSQSDIDEIIGAYDSMSGRVAGGMPDMISQIYAALTDGLPDDEQALTGLKDTAVGQALDAVESWLNEEVGKLDTNSATYAQDVAALTQQAATWRSEITTLDREMQSLISQLAGQPTAVVQKRIDEFIALEERANALAERLAEVTESGKSAAQLDYEIVTSGASTDANKIGIAEAYSNALYEDDLKKIEEYAKQQREDADAAWENGFVGAGDADRDETRRKAEEQIAAEVEEMKRTAMESYRGRAGEIWAGVIEAFVASDPEKYGALPRLSELFDAQEMVDQLAKDIYSGDIDNTSAMGALQHIFDSFFPEHAEEFATPTQGVAMLNDLIPDAINEALASLKLEDGTNPLISVLNGLMTSDALEGFVPDGAPVEEKLIFMLKQIDVSGESESIGVDTVDGLIAGMNSRRGIAIAAARGIASGMLAALRNVLGIASPSKVAMSYGEYFGQGFEIGVKESLGKAIRTIDNVIGDANFSRRAAPSAYDLGSAVTAALRSMQAGPETDPVFRFYVNGRDLAEVTTTDYSGALNSYNRQIAMGVGK